MINKKIVKKGTFLYDENIVCDLEIIQTSVRHGTGDPYDPKEIREDKKGTFYFIRFSSPFGRNKGLSQSFYHNNLKDAIKEAESAARNIEWEEMREKN